MSRVDEALTKANAPSAADGTLSVARPRRVADTLESYPAERGAATDGLREYATEVPVRARRVERQRSEIALTQSPPASPPANRVSTAFDGKLVSADAPSVSIEQYRRLAAVMHELQLERNLKTLMVTSALPREGKTLTVTNLALTLSGSYNRRVLLIDADLRRPTVHEVLNLPNTAGLSEALRSERAELPIRQIMPTLTVLTAGQTDGSPMALLTSERMQRLLDDAAARFDWVLLDAPPVGFMPDAGLLASMTRAVLFVIGAGTTHYQLVQRATAELGRDVIIGTVLNRVDESSFAGSDYEQYYTTRP